MSKKYFNGIFKDSRDPNHSYCRVEESVWCSGTVKTSRLSLRRARQGEEDHIRDTLVPYIRRRDRVYGFSFSLPGRFLEGVQE